jgi:hypothetical protein
MDDEKTLRNLLKEEKRRERERVERKEDKRDPRKEDKREDKREHRRKEDRREDKREDKREHRREQKEKESIERVEIEDDLERFMFLFEDSEGKLYSDLNKIEKGEVKIFPVYVSKGNTNFNEEIITYSDNNWTTKEDNTWLSVINSEDPKIKVLPFDLEDVVVYNNQFYHCIDDFIDYVTSFGPDVLPVNK